MTRDPRYDMPDTVADVSDWWADSPKACEHCGEYDYGSPNVEAFELSGEIVCDDCAEEIFEENSQFGMGS
jgi:superfamily II helicase